MDNAVDPRARTLALVILFALMALSVAGALAFALSSGFTLG